MKLHGEEVKVGDKVWHVRYGWGKVTWLDDKGTNYPILVHWENWSGWFAEDGKWHAAEIISTLFWQPIEIPKKPKPKTEKAWQWIYFNCQPKQFGITCVHYSSADEVYSFFPKDKYKVICPFLPSEIEREVKE